MIIDNPQVYREVVEESGAYFTHPGAEEVVTDMANELDEYAAKFGDLADHVWQEEYLSRQQVATR